MHTFDAYTVDCDTSPDLTGIYPRKVSILVPEHTVQALRQDDAPNITVRYTLYGEQKVTRPNGPRRMVIHHQPNGATMYELFFDIV